MNVGLLRGDLVITDPIVSPQLSSEQLVMLLELLLEETTISNATMLTLQKTYNLQKEDAEVR